MAVLCWGQGGTGPPNLAQAPQIFFRDSVLLLVDVIGSIIISLSRCCLPNDEGPASPQYFFLEPPVEKTFFACVNFTTESHAVEDIFQLSVNRVIINAFCKSA